MHRSAKDYIYFNINLREGAWGLFEDQGLKAI
jgi:hypothetical protein